MRQIVKELGEAMREVGATRAKWSDGTKTLELELGPKPAAEGDVIPRAKAFGEDGEPRCPCGHGEMTEHSAAGCLRGCPDEKCNPPGEEPKE